MLAKVLGYDDVLIQRVVQVAVAWSISDYGQVHGVSENVHVARACFAQKRCRFV